MRKYNVTAALFGSRAKGESTPASDYDLLLICEDPSTSEKILRDLREARIPMDAHCFTLSEALEAPLSSTVILDALTDGTVLREGISLRPLIEKLKSLDLPSLASTQNRTGYTHAGEIIG